MRGSRGYQVMGGNVRDEKIGSRNIETVIQLIQLGDVDEWSKPSCESG